MTSKDSPATPAKKGGLSGRGVIAIAIVVVLVIFFLLNMQSVQVNLFGWTVSIWLWLLLVITFALGMLLDNMVMGIIRKLRGKPHKD